MKKCILFSAAIFTMIVGQAQTRGTIDKNTKVLTVKAELADQYSVIGFAEPDRRSKKMILFSVYGNEVRDNPMNFPLGAYHETIGLREGERIEYDSEAGQYIKFNFIHADKSITPFYLGRSFVKPRP